jgi:carbonic anhydrase
MSISKIIALSALPFAYAQVAPPVWNYADAGANWNKDYLLCANANQSPINLPMDGKGDNFSASMEAPNMAVTLTLSSIVGGAFAAVGTPINFYQLVSKGGSISVTKFDGQPASGTLERIEIHGPSEHKFDGEARDLEIQYFFTNKIALSITYEGVDDTKNDKGETVAATIDPLLAQLFKTDYKSFDVNTVSPFSYFSEKKRQFPH